MSFLGNSMFELTLNSTYRFRMDISQRSDADVSPSTSRKTLGTRSTIARLGDFKTN